MATYLETDRIMLRKFTQNDGELLVDLDSDPEVIRYTQATVRYGGKPPSIEIFQNEILPGYISLYDKFPDFGFFAAFEKNSGEFLGWFHLVPEGSSRAELGYRLKRKYWGQGLATEGSKALIEKGFKDLGLLEIFSGALVANSASIRVMEKCGLELIKNYNHKNGAAVEYGLSREEWQKNHGKRSHKINFEDTIEYQEQKASEQILPELKEHLSYLDQVYEFCFSATQSLNSQTYNQVSKVLRCQLMILMRITDFLRSIRFLVMDGYPEQACTLASSIFELAHTSAYFLHTPEAVGKWYGCKDIEATMPQLIGVKGYRDLVKKNYAYKNLEQYSDNEFIIYQQLCWMKHSHPVMQDLLLKDNKVQFQIGPYTDEKSINHAWFSIDHSGRLTTLVIGNLKTLKDEEFIAIRLAELAKIREELSKKALARFGSDDPFKKI